MTTHLITRALVVAVGHNLKCSDTSRIPVDHVEMVLVDGWVTKDGTFSGG